MPECACGCGERTAGGLFRPGHDQKLRSDTEARVGGVLRLARLVDAAESFSQGKISADELATRVRAIIPTSSSG